MHRHHRPMPPGSDSGLHLNALGPRPDDALPQDRSWRDLLQRVAPVVAMVALTLVIVGCLQDESTPAAMQTATGDPLPTATPQPAAAAPGNTPEAGADGGSGSILTDVNALIGVMEGLGRGNALSPDQADCVRAEARNHAVAFEAFGLIIDACGQGDIATATITGVFDPLTGASARIADDVVDEVLALPQVVRAEPMLTAFETVFTLDESGNPQSRQRGGPVVATTWSGLPPSAPPFALHEGAEPRGQQIAIDREQAAAGGFVVGDTVDVLIAPDGEILPFEISGIIAYVHTTGAYLNLFDLPTLQSVLPDAEGLIDGVVASGAADVSRIELIGTLIARFGADPAYEITTRSTDHPVALLAIVLADIDDNLSEAETSCVAERLVELFKTPQSDPDERLLPGPTVSVAASNCGIFGRLINTQGVLSQEAAICIDAEARLNPVTGDPFDPQTRHTFSAACGPTQ